MPQFVLTTSSAQKILTKHNLGQLVSLQEIKSGSINPVFLINEKYILRFDLGNPEYKNKLQKEVILYKLLPKFSVPTPHVIAIDESRQLVANPYFALSYLPGLTLKTGFPSQTQNTKDTLSSELGSLLKNIHSVTQDDLDSTEMFGDINTWVDKIKTNFTLYFSFVRENKYFSDEVNFQIESVFSDYLKISNWEKIGRLTHGDINPGNIMIDLGHITGIFDFEYACVADPFIDFERLPINYQLGNDFSQNLFLENYGIAGFTHEQITRLKTYSLSQGLWEIWATATHQFPYGPEVIEEGKLLVKNTLNITLSSAKQ